MNDFKREQGMYFSFQYVVQLWFAHGNSAGTSTLKSVPESQNGLVVLPLLND
jgi:hypothetical protein